MTEIRKPIRIAHIANTDFAVRFLLFNQLLYMKDSGYDVTAVCGDGQLLREVRERGITVFTVPIQRAISPLSDILTLFRLVRFFRRERFDVVHTHTPKAILLGTLAAWIARTPLRVITFHGFFFDENTPHHRKRFFIFTDTIAVRCANWVFCQNQEDIGTAIREKISPANKLHFLGNGVDLEHFRKQCHAEDRDLLRRQMNIPPGAPVIGIVARMTFEKGFREFVEAAKIIYSRRSDAHFIAVGPDDVISRGAIDKLIKGTPVEAHMHFVGVQVDMPKYYAIMDVLTLPSYREGMPRVLIEAAAMSIPAVATDIRGCRNIVKHGETGLLVPVRDSVRLAEAVLEMINETQKANAFGRAARQKAEQDFDERKIFERIAKAYTEIAQLQTRL